jgi:hypothetical protein
LAARLIPRPRDSGYRLEAVLVAGRNGEAVARPPCGVPNPDSPRGSTPGGAGAGGSARAAAPWPPGSDAPRASSLDQARRTGKTWPRRRFGHRPGSANIIQSGENGRFDLQRVEHRAGSRRPPGAAPPVKAEGATLATKCRAPRQLVHVLLELDRIKLQLVLGVGVRPAGGGERYFGRLAALAPVSRVRWRSRTRITVRRSRRAEGKV